MRTVLITGAARGIGKAIADEFRSHDWRAITPPRDELDLADDDSVRRFTEDIAKVQVDALVNNAGVNFLGSLGEIDERRWAEMLQVNITSPRRLIEAVVEPMRKAHWGRIVGISSIFGTVSRARRAAYSVTKAGLDALTRTAAIEFGPDNILVNSVAPGYIDTDLTRANNSPEEIAKICEAIPLRRMAKAEEIAKLVYFLCSEENTYITGQALIVDGGFTVQ
jgi:3-oxoacyl-[acyl-carrier protein] reductase